MAGWGTMGEVPLTFVHPAAVVPLLRRRGLVPAALVIGAMTPDFEYFLRLDTVSKVTHTLPGLAYGCVPLGLLALWAWQAVIRDPFVAATPTVVRDRVGHLSSSGVPHTVWMWLVAGLSVLIGAATHLLWDSFTHPGYLPAQWLGLTASSPVLGLPWTSVLQRTSDLAGVIVLVVVIARLPRRPVQGSHHPWRFWLVTALTTLALVAGRTLLQPDWLRLSTAVATFIAGGLLGLFAAASCERRRRRSSEPVAITATDAGF